MRRGRTSRTRVAAALAALSCAALPPAAGTARAALAPDPVDDRPPATRITTGPAPSTASNRATFRFTADEPATFQCKLDAGKWHSCKSKKVVNVAKGRHTFRVRATDEAGNRDPKPASYSWRVVASRGS
jgi:hypothetical protein